MDINGLLCNYNLINHFTKLIKRKGEESWELLKK